MCSAGLAGSPSIGSAISRNLVKGLWGKTDKLLAPQQKGKLSYSATPLKTPYNSALKVTA